MKFIESSKRKDYLSWDEFFMGVAILSSGRSKDPNTQVGACIVDTNNRILSLVIMGLQMVLMMIYFIGTVKEII